jgi:hypothetical protein
MEKLTDNRSGNLGENLGELWIKMENATDNDTFTLLCEEFAREGGVKPL